MLTVASVLRSGGIYTPAWVARLKGMVGRHLQQPHRFVCMTDVADVPDALPLLDNWPGWWAKMELFRLKGPVLYFDLDTLIIGDLGGIAAQAEAAEFTVLRDFYAPESGIGSGMMAWGGDLSRFYDAYGEAPDLWQRRSGGRGDQGTIQAMASRSYLSFWQDEAPGQVVSYKARGCEAGPPPGARVVCLHGFPKFHEMAPTSWARKAWEAAA